MLRDRCSKMFILFAVLSFGFVNDPLRADDTAKEFNIPAGDLGTALREFGRQSNQQILFSTDVVQGKATRGIKGSLDTQTALAKLLVGTGLTFSKSADGSLLISRADGLGASAPAGLASTPVGASNDQNSSKTRANPDDSGHLEEIIVTATRQEQNLQAVPVAITALSQKQLNEQSIYDVWELDRAVPGLTVVADSGNGNRANFAIRGRGLDYGAQSGSVETYFADVPLSSPFEAPSAPAPFFDLQSVQVLKGPQGTLFGRSTTGGAVLVVPEAPTDQFGGYARVQGGDYGDVQFETAINLPIDGSKADLRLAGFFWNRDGYSHTLGSIAGASPVLGPWRDPEGQLLPPQTFNNQEDRDFRATLLLRPNDQLTNSTIFAFDSFNTRATAGAQIIIPTSPLGGAVLSLYPDILKTGPYVVNVDTNLDHPASTSFEVINTLTYGISSDLRIKDIFGFIEAHGITNQAADVDNTPLPAIDLVTPPVIARNYQYTNELQLLGDSFDNRFSWILGGIVDDTREPGGNHIDNFVDYYAAPSYTVTWEQNNYSDYALFGSGTYKLTDMLSVTVGERHSWDHISVLNETDIATNTAAYNANPNLTPAGAAASNASNPGSWMLSPTVNLTRLFVGDTYNVGIQDQVTDRTLVYGGYRRGYKPGGFNSRAPANQQDFGPEDVDDFYTGLKTSFTIGNVRGRFNIEGYWDLYHNKQGSNLILVTGGELDTITTNTPGTTYRGIDADMTLEPTAWLALIANYSLIDAYNTRWPDVSGVGLPVPNAHLNLAVNPVAFAPKNKVTATLRFHSELPADKGELVFAPTVTYEDKWFLNNNTLLLPQATTLGLGIPQNFSYQAYGGGFVPAHTLTNLRAEWNHLWGSRIDAAANVTNVTNRAVSLGPTATLEIGIQGSNYAPPRMFSVDLSTKF
jgi:iron complex outermembrane receptor protein